MADLAVRVTGQKELRAALRALDGKWPVELRKANKLIADLVAGAARSTASGQGSTAAHVAGTIRSLGSQSRAAIVLGNAAHPEAGGAEFGSIRYRQFKAWRGSGPDAGYFLYPTIRDKKDEIVETYGELLDELTSRAFPD